MVGDELVVDGHPIRALAEPSPANLPWRELEVDVVIESTGRYRTRSAAAEHLAAGTHKVIVSAPGKGSEPLDATVVIGVNFEQVYDPDRHHIISNASSVRPTASRRSRRSSTTRSASATG